jgi:hypothetical protein
VSAPNPTDLLMAQTVASMQAGLAPAPLLQPRITEPKLCRRTQNRIKSTAEVLDRAADQVDNQRRELRVYMEAAGKLSPEVEDALREAMTALLTTQGRLAQERETLRAVVQRLAVARERALASGAFHNDPDYA